MASSLSNLVYNKDKDYFLQYESIKDNLTKYKCLSCNKDYSNNLDEKLKKRLRIHLHFLIITSINLLS